MPNPNAALKILSQRTYWVAEGTEPADESKDWLVRQRPPSSWFDWWFYSTYKDIEELALYVQRFGVSREFSPGQFELPGDDAAHIAEVGTLKLPVAVFAAGVKRHLHIATRVAMPTTEDTVVKVVWSSPNTVASKDAYLKIEYQTTGAGESRNGATASQAVVAADSQNNLGQNETWINLGSLTQGEMLDIFLIVDATQASHTLTEPVYVHQIIVDPEPES